MSLECVSIICSLAFPTFYSSAIAFRGSLSLVLLLYRATVVKPGGSPSHFRVYWLIFLPMTSTVARLTSYICNGHRSLGISMNWRIHTLNRPCTSVLFMVFSPLSASSFIPWLCMVSLSDQSYHLPRLLTGCSHTVGIAWPS